MALHALEHRNVAQVDRVLKRRVRLVATFAFAFRKASKIDWMLIGAKLHRSRGICRIINYGMANIAVVSNDLASTAHVLTVVATKTTIEIKMSDVVRVSLPVSLHFGEKIGAKDSLEFGR